MKSFILSFISVIGFVSCSHHSFDEVSYYDIKTCNSSCIIATDIRNDISGFHELAYLDAKIILDDLVDNCVEVASIVDYLTEKLSKKYPKEMVNTVVKNLVYIYEDAERGMDDVFILPLVSVGAIIENGVALSKIEERPIVITK